MTATARLSIAPLLFFGAATLLSLPAPAWSLPEDGDGANYCMRLMNAQLSQQLRTRAARTGVAGSAPETTWVGHRPGQTRNYWEVGVGPNRPGVAPGGVWNWDQPVKGDSLQGWWPLRIRYASTGGQTRSDRNRPWWALDYGNIASYVINQGPGHQRTFGVVGVWHRDGGNRVPAPGGIGTPSWAPLGGDYSAWMGLRRHGDDSFVDPVTGNPFNEDVLMFSAANAASPGGNDKGFPGYGSQMDQMLYRDINLSVAADSSLTLSFRYRTNMSTGYATTASTRTGWFDKDPTSVTSGAANPQPGNFISSTEAGVNAPRDSFMVYVGTPVDEAACLYSDGTTAPVYDPQRRWFAEVVRANEGLYRQLLSAAGDQPPVTRTVTIPAAALAPLIAPSGGRLRLVFRVKTNRGFDDEGAAYSSDGAGAAVVDDVTFRIGSGPVAVLGDFERESDIDNDVAVDPLNAWKSTGKPPAIYDHPHRLSDLVYEDICGPVGSPNRLCDMSGVVISSGDHDRSEAAGGLVDGAADRETYTGFISPTICLKTAGPTIPNDWDITGDMADATAGYAIWYEIYTGIFDLFTRGNLWVGAVQTFPGNAKASSGGYPAWGALQFPGCVVFNPEKQCLQDLGYFLASNMRTSNPTGIPDSIRIFLGKQQHCYRFGVSTGCSSTDGAYWDNVALAMVDGPDPPQPSVDMWHWYQDAFPANETPGIAGVPAAFDTTAAWIKTGLNIAPHTGNLTRADVPGDSAVVYGSVTVKRMDMVFRVLPGPGNYQPVGDGRRGTLRRTPADPAPFVAGDGSFWDVYRRFPGEFASPGASQLHAQAPGGWDPNAWVSARCDTAESNLWAFQGRGVPGGPWTPQVFMSTYHESDEKFPLLAIEKNICFVRCENCPATDVVCDGTVPSYLPAGTPARTREGAKIIPDGLLTPGSHVQYFFREQRDAPTPARAVAMVPDTSVVFPQVGESSVDGHRWQEFSVLPDRWKDPGYLHPVTNTYGRGPACLLVVDVADRRGDEMTWVGVADTIGATARARWGAHNGWQARGDQDPNDPAARVALHGGHPGTTWDLYQVKGGEALTAPAGTIGSRLAYRGGPAKLADQSSRQGPTPEMLAAYYRTLLVLAGDAGSGILGPFSNKSQDDVGILREFLLAATPQSPRGLIVMGDAFVEFMANQGGPQGAFLSGQLGAGLRSPSYAILSGSGRVGPRVVDLFPTPALTMGERVYGVRNRCIFAPDVLTVSGALPEAIEGARYQDFGAGPHVASVYKAATPERPWVSLVNGMSIANLRSRDGSGHGRLAYVFETLNRAFATICAVAGNPVVPLDVPSFDDGRLVDFLALANNPLRAGDAAVRFGLARPDRVEVRVYDLGGRLVRTLADRHFAAGEHALVWDGLDDDRRPVPRGVYFTRVRHRDGGFEGTRKITVLK